MKMSLGAVVATTAAIFCASTALAEGTGAQGVFTIHNSTDANTVTGFYTNGGDGWSPNWLSGRIAPGETAQAQFHANTGPCEQTFRVGWLGQDGGEVLDEPIDINICDASNVYLEDNDISYD